MIDRADAPLSSAPRDAPCERKLTPGSSVVVGELAAESCRFDISSIGTAWTRARLSNSSTSTASGRHVSMLRPGVCETTESRWQGGLAQGDWRSDPFADKGARRVTMARRQIYKIRFRLSDKNERIVRTQLREEAREKIRAQLQADPLTGVEIWADGKKLSSAEQEKLIGDVPI